MTTTPIPSPTVSSPSGSVGDEAVALTAEREPSVEQLVNERDPRALDAAFYTGLGWRLSRMIQRELDREITRQEVNRFERRHCFR
jgi:hypothetical protein